MYNQIINKIMSLLYLQIMWVCIVSKVAHNGQTKHRFYIAPFTFFRCLTRGRKGCSKGVVNQQLHLYVPLNPIFT